MRALRAITVAALLASVAACRSGPSEKVTVLNPPDVVDGPISHQVPYVERSSGASAYADLVSARQVRSFEIDTGPDRGEPTDISITPDGDVAVADRRTGQVFTHSSDGRTVRMIAESVPREFRLQRPHSIIPMRQGLWAIGDASETIKFFANSRGTLTPVRTIASRRGDDACGFDDLIVVRSISDDLNLFHVYDANGTALRAFGKVFQHQSKIVRDSMSDGIVGCLPKAKAVIAVQHALPIVRAYGLDGAERWATKLDGVRPLTISAVGDGFIYAVRKQGTEYDVPASINELDGERILIQFARVTRRGETDVEIRIHSVALSARTGEGAYLGTSLPLVLEVVGRRLYATTLTKRGPLTITIYDMEGGES